MTRRTRRAWVLSLLAVLLLGCGTAAERAREVRPVQRFVLDTGPTAARRVVTGELPVVEVAMPLVDSEFATRRMAYRQRPGTLDYFAFSEWAAPPVEMVQRALYRAFDADGTLLAVTNAGAAARGKLRVETRLVECLQDFAVSPSRTRIALRVKVLDATDGALLAAATFVEEAPAASEDPAGGAAAGAVALDRIARAVASLAAAALEATVHDVSALHEGLTRRGAAEGASWTYW